MDMVEIPSGFIKYANVENGWKWTIYRWSSILKPPFSSGIFQPAMFDYWRVPQRLHHRHFLEVPMAFFWGGFLSLKGKWFILINIYVIYIYIYDTYVYWFIYLCDFYVNRHDITFEGVGQDPIAGIASLSDRLHLVDVMWASVVLPFGAWDYVGLVNIYSIDIYRSYIYRTFR